MSVKSYFRKKMLIDFILVNLIINAISYLMGFLIKTISAVVAAIMVGYIVINLILSDHRSLCI